MFDKFLKIFAAIVLSTALLWMWFLLYAMFIIVNDAKFP